MTTITLAGNKAVHMDIGSSALISQMYILYKLVIQSL